MTLETVFFCLHKNVWLESHTRVFVFIQWHVSGVGLRLPHIVGLSLCITPRPVWQNRRVPLLHWISRHKIFGSAVCLLTYHNVGPPADHFIILHESLETIFSQFVTRFTKTIHRSALPYEWGRSGKREQGIQKGPRRHLHVPPGSTTAYKLASPNEAQNSESFNFNDEFLLRSTGPLIEFLVPDTKQQKPISISFYYINIERFKLSNRAILLGINVRTCDSACIRRARRGEVEHSSPLLLLVHAPSYLGIRILHFAMRASKQYSPTISSCSRKRFSDFLTQLNDDMDEDVDIPAPTAPQLDFRKRYTSLPNLPVSNTQRSLNFCFSLRLV